MRGYASFLDAKQHETRMGGFEPVWMPDWLFDFQKALVQWATLKGCAAILADCGLGKTPMQLVWAQNIVQATNRHVLIVAPLAASTQTVREAAKFSIPAVRSSTGDLPASASIVITNYERLHLFDSHQFAGVVCDESSILKNFDGATKAAITEFMRKMSYRLLCTATAAPNDYIELGTSSEALGQLGYMDMLSMFFKNDEGSISPLSYEAKWRFKPHAERPFWQWLCSWARAVRKPSDLGFDNGRFVLPALREHVDVVAASRPMDGQLFIMPAQTLQEQRAERRATIRERCEAVASYAAVEGPFIAWCHLNDEADLVEEMVPGAVQVSGSDDDEAKLEKFEAFTSGQARVLVTKPRIAAFGLNWQQCARMSMFPSHSYEQYYQAVRRCWRFGQTKPVDVYLVTTEGEADVLGNLKRKSDAADLMFSEMVAAMAQAMSVEARPDRSGGAVAIPAWMESVTV